MKRKRLKCRYKVTSTHLCEDVHFASQPGPDESKCIHQRGYWNITDIKGLFWNRWIKEMRKRSDLHWLICSEAWWEDRRGSCQHSQYLIVCEAFCLTTHCKLDYHPTPPSKRKFNKPRHRLRGYWNLNLVLLFSGNKPQSAGGGGGGRRSSHPPLQLALPRGRASKVIPPAP